MAQRVLTLLVSDLSGEELGGGGETVTFTYRGVDYEIDVSPDESAEFDQVMAKYVQHGRRVGGRRQTRAGKTPGQAKRNSMPSGHGRARTVTRSVTGDVSASG